MRNELGSTIKLIAHNLDFFRHVINPDAGSSASSTSSKGSKMKAVSSRILRLAYEILCIFCDSHGANQLISFEFMKNYLEDIGICVGAEEIVI